MLKQDIPRGLPLLGVFVAAIIISGCCDALPLMTTYHPKPYGSDTSGISAFPDLIGVDLDTAFVSPPDEFMTFLDEHGLEDVTECYISPKPTFEKPNPYPIGGVMILRKRRGTLDPLYSKELAAIRTHPNVLRAGPLIDRHYPLTIISDLVEFRYDQWAAESDIRAIMNVLDLTMVDSVTALAAPEVGEGIREKVKQIRKYDVITEARMVLKECR